MLFNVFHCHNGLVNNESKLLSQVCIKPSDRLSRTFIYVLLVDVNVVSWIQGKFG